MKEFGANHVQDPLKIRLSVLLPSHGSWLRVCRSESLSNHWRPFAVTEQLNALIHFGPYRHFLKCSFFPPPYFLFLKNAYPSRLKREKK